MLLLHRLMVCHHGIVFLFHLIMLLLHELKLLVEFFIGQFLGIRIVQKCLVLFYDSIMFLNDRLMFVHHLPMLIANGDKQRIFLTFKSTLMLSHPFLMYIFYAVVLGFHLLVNFFNLSMLVAKIFQCILVL